MFIWDLVDMRGSIGASEGEGEGEKDGDRPRTLVLSERIGLSSRDVADVD